MESINNGKATITTSLNEIDILIPSKKNWFVLIFGTAWLGGWYLGLQNALEMLESGFRGFTFFWLIAWSVGGLGITGLLLWGYFGKEMLHISSDKVLLNKTIFGIGIKKALQKSAVKNVRFNKVEIEYFKNNQNWAIWGVGEGKIKFDYGMKTYSLGLGVDDAEANYIIEKIKARIEDC